MRNNTKTQFVMLAKDVRKTDSVMKGVGSDFVLGSVEGCWIHFFSNCSQLSMTSMGVIVQTYYIREE